MGFNGEDKMVVRKRIERRARTAPTRFFETVMFISSVRRKRCTSEIEIKTFC